MADFLMQDVLGPAKEVKGRDITVIDIIEAATAKLEEGKFDDQLLVEASIHAKLANVYDMLVIYISLANNLAERKMGATMGKEAPGSLKNLPTKMTCTLAC